MADDDDYATRYPWRKPNLPSWMRDEDKMKDDDDDEEGDDDKDMKDAHDAEIIDADGKHMATVAVEKNGVLATTTAQH
jgi:hypothetical protein